MARNHIEIQVEGLNIVVVVLPTLGLEDGAAD